MRVIQCIIFLLPLGIICNAQIKFNYTWVSGVFKTYDIKYNGIEMAFADSIYSTTYLNGKGGSNICDSNGNIILMSNGYVIFNSAKHIIENGDSIGGRDLMVHDYGFSGYSQACLFLPFDNNTYYMPYGSASDSEYYKAMNIPGHNAVFDILGYCKIDMKLNAGEGKVVEREKLLIQNDTLAKTQMMACKHANGKDWWLLKQGFLANKIYKFLFTQDSVYDYGFQYFSEPVFSIYDHSGQSMFSSDGKKYATTNRGAGKVFVADFDRCHGVLSNPQVYNVANFTMYNPNDSTIFFDDIETNGLEFSPNGRFLYVCKYGNIMQLDLTDPDTLTAWYHLAGFDTTWDAFQIYQSMQLGPDNRIYIGNWGNALGQMSRIDNPDVKGAGCNFCPRCLRMPGNGLQAPPAMPNYDLGAELPCWPLGVASTPLRYLLDIEVWPNPASGKFQIKCKDPKSKKELYNCVGELIYTTTKNEIDVSRFAKGVYYLKCEGECKKVVVE